MGMNVLVVANNLHLFGFFSSSKHVVFGEVVSGQHVVDAIENISVDSNSRPLKPVVITHCAQLVLVTSKSCEQSTFVLSKNGFDFV